LSRLPIAASQTYKAGDFLALNSSGQLIQAAAPGDGTSSNGQVGSISGLTGLIVGRATEDAQPATNDVTIIPTTKLYGEFIVAEPGTQFELPIYHATAASAYPNPNLFTNNYELWNLSGASTQTMQSGSSWASCYGVRIDKTTNGKMQIVDFVPDEYPLWPDVGQATPPSTGTLSQYCRAWVEFIGAACALSGARPITRS
jgi:hypothetical protein